jgi:outer membrane protein OmpA-like peptidoglycan-associated protein
MRKWCVTLAIGALLAMPVFGQKSNTAADENSNPSNTAASAEKGAPANSAALSAPAPRNPFAAPAPRRSAAGGPAKDKGTEEAPGRLLPRYEIAGMYNYVRFEPGSPFSSFGGQGGSGSFTYNATKLLGITGEVGGFQSQRNTNTGATPPAPTDKVTGGITTVLVGPRLNLRRFDYFVPFGEVLFGGAHGGSQINGDRSQSTFAMAVGGGVDVVITKYLAWRFAQLDYLMTNFSGSTLGQTSRQNNFRIGSGIVLRFGIPNPPPPPNHPPIAACSANPPLVTAGSGDSVAVHVNASDPDNDPLTYSYTATGGAVDGTGPDARWNSSGLSAGTYTVNVKVDDGRGGTATCSTDITVQPKPHNPPTISCSTDRSPIMPGERTGITSVGNSPDGDQLTYSYATNGGQIIGSGPKVQFDSTGLAAGSYNVKCSVADEHSATADSSTNVDVQQPPPPPQATKVGDCGYVKPGVSRFDNLCKRVGDDVALRLQNDPNAKVVIVGFADPKEPKAAKLAETRAELAKKYLGEKGIDASRISTRAGSASAEKGTEKENRRVDFIFVPEGATY